MTELINQKLAQERANVRAEEEDEEEEEYDEDGNRKGPTAKALAKQFEPSVLEAKFLTEEDEAIQRADVPERHQVSWGVVGMFVCYLVVFNKRMNVLVPAFLPLFLFLSCNQCDSFNSLFSVS